MEENNLLGFDDDDDIDLGGTTTEDNLITACEHCNKVKGASSIYST